MMRAAGSRQLGAELKEIERRRDAARAAPSDARVKLEKLMDEAGAAEQRRVEASDRVAEAEGRRTRR